MKKIFFTFVLLGMLSEASAGLLRQSVGYESDVPVTNAIIATFDVRVGDVIAVLGAANNDLLINDPGAVSAAGVSFTFGFKLGSGPRTAYWYGAATSAGVLDVRYSTSTDKTAGRLTLGAYHLRSDTGSPIQMLDTVSAAASGTSLSVSYSFGSIIPQGIYLEAASTYGAFQSLPAVDANSHDSNKFIVRHGAFTNSAGFNSIYSVSPDSAIAVSGVAFLEEVWLGGNRNPVFYFSPVVKSGAFSDELYTDSLSGDAFDPDDDPITFSKTGGPGWLSVAANGVLSGTPLGTDVGVNEFSIQVVDDQGGTNSTLLQITVQSSEFQPVSLSSTNLYVSGAKYTHIDGAGMNFHRFDAGIISGSTAVNVNPTKAKTTSGVKLTFYTRSDNINLYFDYLVGDENRGSWYGIYQNGAYDKTLYFSSSKTSIEINLTSQGSPGELVRYDVVLPNWANPILTRMEIKTGTVLEAGNPFPAKKMVVLGDSISHGTGQTASFLTYPYIVAEALGAELFNLAVGGGRIAPEIADLLQDFEPVDTIWVLAGYNNWQGSSESIATITSDYETLLATIRAHQPDAELYCCTLTYTTNIDDPESGVTATEVRSAVTAVVNARIASGDSRLHLVNGDQHTDASYIYDAVHFNEPGAALFAQDVISIINPPPPNVLFIAIDDINPILGCYGNTQIITPNIDRLAARGMVFENAHCQWSVCGPSRASLMTGLMPEQSGVMAFTKMRGDGVDDTKDNAIGLTNLVTLPQYFISQGYETAACGKVNDARCVGSINSNGTVNEDGNTVDDPPSWSYAFLNNYGPVHSSSAIRSTDSKSVLLAAESVDQPASSFTDWVVASDGITLMNDLVAQDKPFFLGVGFKKPHLPFLAPKSSWDLYNREDFTPHPFQTEMLNATPFTFNGIKELRTSYYLELDGTGKALPITPGILQDDQQKLLLHAYYACISHIDELVGRLLDELDSLELTDNTIIVLWGDNGFHLGDHNEWGKHTHLEQASRVPLIISAPGFPQGRKTTSPVGLLDIYPTLCDLAGLPVPEQPLSESVSDGRPLAGRSLIPILSDPNAMVQTGIMNHYGSDTFGYAYRTERYRYTEWIDSSGVVQARELYDYELDPMETVNLATYPEYEGLMYQYSKSMRDASECGGCDRLKASPVYDGTGGDRSLSGLKISAGGISWADAAGSTYVLMSKTNLTDTLWTTNRVGLTGSPASIAISKNHEFFKIEVSE